MQVSFVRESRAATEYLACSYANLHCDPGITDHCFVVISFMDRCTLCMQGCLELPSL